MNMTNFDVNNPHDRLKLYEEMLEGFEYARKNIGYKLRPRDRSEKWDSIIARNSNCYFGLCDMLYCLTDGTISIDQLPELIDNKPKGAIEWNYWWHYTLIETRCAFLYDVIYEMSIEMGIC